MKTVLVTGDDGYKALGIKLIAHMLKDDYKVTVVATKSQKSATGGSPLSFGKKNWGFEVVNGIDSYWVEGNPVDAMEFAQGKFPQGFDYLISGINWGENIGGSVYTFSGTCGAALRALGLAMVDHVIMMSWMQDHQNASWAEDSSNLDPDHFIDNPGRSARFIFEEIIRNDYWGKRIVNVNFPHEATMEYKITKLLDDHTKYFKYPVIINEESYEYHTQVLNIADEVKNSVETDGGAIINGYISVTPFDIG